MSEGTPTQVAIVEDDPDVRDSLCAVVLAMGHRYVTFDAAEPLLTCQRFSELGCLLVDYNLPGMNGMELLLALRKSGDVPPSCLYTGQIKATTLNAPVALGFAEVLEKGNDTGSIEEYLRRVLSRVA